MRDDAAGPIEGDSKKQIDFVLLIEAAHGATTEAPIASQDGQVEVLEPSPPSFPASERTDG